MVVESGEAGLLKMPSLDKGRCGVLPARDLSGETNGLWTALFKRRLFASGSASAMVSTNGLHGGSRAVEGKSDSGGESMVFYRSRTLSRDYVRSK